MEKNLIPNALNMLTKKRLQPDTINEQDFDDECSKYADKRTPAPGYDK